MKILKILGIAAGAHALALVLLLSSPGCSNTKAAGPDASPITAAPTDTSAQGATITVPDSVGIRYSPTRPGTTVASALEAQPVTGVTPATTYTVGKGDNLSGIAKKNQITKADLAAANNLKLGSILHVGQKLIIPSKPGQESAGVPASTPEPTAKAAEASPSDRALAESTRHVVKPGETLGGIARKYGVKQGEIAVANNITDPRKIQPGQELIIPGKSSTTTAKQARSTKAAAPDASGPAAGETSGKPAGAPPADQDLDAGLKSSSAADVPVVKIEDPSAAQPKNP
jgi:LysM repeat protein